MLNVQHIENNIKTNTYYEQQLIQMIIWMFSLCVFSLSVCSSFLLLFCLLFFWLMLTYLLWMVSSAWFAWSKCPPLHPCCHRGNQPGQTTQRVIVLYLFHDIVSLTFCLYLPPRLWILKGLCPCCLLSLASDLSLRDDSPLWADSLGFLISLSKHTHKLLLAFCATPSVLCLILLICQPFPLFLAPCLLMLSCCCGVLVTNAVLSNDTTDKWMVAGEGHAFQADRSLLLVSLFTALKHKHAHIETHDG